MTVCPRCGTQNDPQVPVCTLCGARLNETSTEERKPEAKPDFGRTLLGQGPTLPAERAPNEDATPPETPGARAERDSGAMLRGATIMGLAPPMPAPREAAPSQNLLGQKTVLGLAPAVVTPGEPTKSSGSVGQKTVLGLAPVAAQRAAFAPTGTLVLQPGARPPNADSGKAPSPPPPPPLGSEPVEQGAPAQDLSGGRTILGVARPGIAPLNPGISKPSEPEKFLSPPPPPPALAPATAAPPAKSAPLAALLSIGGALILMAVAAAAYFVVRGPGRIETRASIDASGHDQVELVCSGCKDGEQVRLEQSAATFRGGRATLPVPSALKIGDNKFELGLAEPGARRETRAFVNVPLEYRARADVNGLNDASPHLTVEVDSTPNSNVIVDTHAVPSQNGQARYDIDVSRELSGLEPQTKTLERKVAYSVTPAGGKEARGEVAFRVGIVPLTLQAPGESITIDTATFLLAGRTLKGGSVSVSGRAINVEPDGHFAQNLAVSALGETTVILRASARDYAPRSYGFRVRRVASLADEARARRASAILSYAAIASDIQQKIGSNVALDGSVIELGGDDFSTLLLLDTKSGCSVPTCITKVVHGARLSLTTGDHVSVFGRVRAAVEGPRSGTQVPEVFADFVLKGQR